MSEEKDWSKRWDDPVKEQLREAREQAGTATLAQRMTFFGMIGGVMFFSLIAIISGSSDHRSTTSETSSPAVPEIGRQYMTAQSCLGTALFEDRNNVSRWLKDREGMRATLISGSLRGVEKSELVRVLDSRSDGILDTVWVQVRRMNEPSMTLWMRHDCLLK